MPRKKTVEMIEQIVNLSDDVQIIARWPKGKKPFITWQGDTITISLSGEVAKQITGLGADQLTNGPDHDTPEIAAARAKLPDVLGGARKFARGSSEEAFAAIGIELEPGELTPEALEAAQTFGGGGTIV